MDVDWISADYFEWMYDLVVEERYSYVSYRKLLTYLHNTEFTWIIPKDANRAADGKKLRYRYALSQGDRHLSEYLDGPCSILEMMIALAVRCEKDYTDDPDYGDRTAQWFWNMIANLGLGSSIDTNFDVDYVYMVIRRFLNREYDSDGKGGLFRVRHTNRDMRNAEIWYQFGWYLEDIM